jgi:hypothetical protein
VFKLCQKPALHPAALPGTSAPVGAAFAWCLTCV